MRREVDPVVIAGGGIGGLSTALALAQHGIASIVCERRPGFAEDGAGIQIGPNGARLLQRLGVAEFLAAAIAVPDAISVRHAINGRRLVRMPLGRWIAERHGAPYWTMHRRDLHAALRGAVERQPLVHVALGAEIVDWRDDAGSISVTDASGLTRRASALIAADGLWSRLRGGISGADAPTSVGKSAYRCVVARSALPAGLDADVVHLWLSAGAHVVHYPVRAGAEVALVLIIDDPAACDGWNAVAEPNLTVAPASHFTPLLRALVQCGAGWRRWSLHAGRPPDRWSNGRAAVLGDAAHPILPFLAQGAVLAIEDAAVLANCLASQDKNVAAALAQYGVMRRRRAARVAAAAERNGRIYHLAGILGSARDTALSLAPPVRLMAGYDWLYGWRC